MKNRNKKPEKPKKQQHFRVKRSYMCLSKGQKSIKN